MTNVEGLIEVLHDEAGVYGELLKLAETKRQVIIDRNLEGLEDTTSAEQELSDQLKSYEGRRIKLLQSFTESTDEIPTVSDIIDALDSGSKEREALKKAKDDILDVAGRMQFLNNQNEVLLQQALEMVEFDLTLFKSLRQAPESGNYGKDAYNTGELLPSGGFDTKQ